MNTTLYRVAVVSDAISPWPAQYSNSCDDNDFVTLSHHLELDHDQPVPRIKTGPQWRTTGRHLRESFIGERSRRMSYLNHLASRLDFVAADTHLSVGELAYRALKTAPAPFPKPSRRLVALLCGAVEAANKKANPRGAPRVVGRCRGFLVPGRPW